MDVELENDNAEIHSDWLNPVINSEAQLVENTLYLRIRYKVSYYDYVTETTKLLSAAPPPIETLAGLRLYDGES